MSTHKPTLAQQAARLYLDRLTRIEQAVELCQLGADPLKTVMKIRKILDNAEGEDPR